MDGLDIALGLEALVLETLLGFEASAFAGFGVFLSVSFHGGHGDLLRTGFVYPFDSNGFEGHDVPLRRIWRGIGCAYRQDII
jgi:hypothetical protein